MVTWFRRYLLPGLVFQSIIIAGGYGTGRELVEFFLRYGPWGGLLAMLLPAMLLVSLTCAVAFELARLTRRYDYRGFLQLILGRAWFLFEIGYLSAVLLILAVIGSAAGVFLSETFGLPGTAGTVGLFLAIAFLTFKGGPTILRVLSVWSFVLYAVYIAFFAVSIARFGPAIADNFATTAPADGWLLSGTRYGALQVSLIPAMLFATVYLTRRREALVAGALAGPIAIIPGVLFFIAMVGQYPAILERPVPANYLLELIGWPWFQVLFQIVLFGTLIETGSGLIHAFNERIAGVFTARGGTMPAPLRPLIAAALLIAGWLLSRLGLVDLIARGYGAMTWVFMAIFVVPLLTVGVIRIRAASREMSMNNVYGKIGR